MKLPQLVSAFVLLVVLQSVASDAGAALTDQQANKQIDNAINTHYASADIDLAEKKLLDTSNEHVAKSIAECKQLLGL